MFGASRMLHRAIPRSVVVQSSSVCVHSSRWLSSEAAARPFKLALLYRYDRVLDPRRLQDWQAREKDAAIKRIGDREERAKMRETMKAGVPGSFSTEPQDTKFVLRAWRADVSAEAVVPGTSTVAQLMTAFEQAAQAEVDSAGLEAEGQPLDSSKALHELTDSTGVDLVYRLPGVSQELRTGVNGGQVLVPAPTKANMTISRFGIGLLGILLAAYQVLRVTSEQSDRDKELVDRVGSTGYGSGGQLSEKKLEEQTKSIEAARDKWLKPQSAD